MATTIKKKKNTPIRKVAVKLACSCWADCQGCACINGKPTATPSGSFNADLCAGAYYIGKAFGE